MLGAVPMETFALVFKFENKNKANKNLKLFYRIESYIKNTPVIQPREFDPWLKSPTCFPFKMFLLLLLAFENVIELHNFTLPCPPFKPSHVLIISLFQIHGILFSVSAATCLYLILIYF